MNMKLKEFAKYLEATSDPAHSRVKELMEGIRRERPYQTPKHYIKWSVLSAALALSIDQRESPYLDQASRLNSYKCALWLVQDAPVYALSPGLLQEFRAAYIEKEREAFKEFSPPHHTLLLLFPQGMMKTPTGSHLDWIIMHISDRSYPERSMGSDSKFGIEVPYFFHDFERNLHYSGISDDDCVWFSGSSITADGENIINTQDSLGKSSLSPEDRRFMKDIRNIGLQCMLALSFAPELIESDQEQRGRRRCQKSSNNRSVRWIGKNYCYQSSKSNLSSGLKRKSPRGHWRRGHWRQVPCGKNRTQRKWVLVKETWVSSR